MSKKKLLGMLALFIMSFFIGAFLKSSEFNLKIKGITSMDHGDLHKPGIKGYENDKNKPNINIEDPLKGKIREMTLDEKIGQMVIVGIEGETLDENWKQLIQKYYVGGVILFKRNIETVQQTMDLINSIKKSNLTNKIPLFISLDEEGGKVSRVPDDFMKIPTNKIIGQVNNRDFSYEIGRAIGKEISNLGFNLDFAPVLDINSNPKNPVIGDRSFGSEEKVVTNLGVSTMKGIMSENIIPVIKHFPGHGDTSVDSHIGLPVVYNNLSRLKNFELIPFKKAIEEGADMVMVAHILLPEIDSNNPASLSKDIITEILRKDLNFNGVVVTDDMTMGAIEDNYGIGDAAVKSVLAGSNIILVCHDIEKEIEVINALKTAVNNKVIPEELIDDCVYKILKLKNKYKISDDYTNEIDIDRINNEIKGVLSKYLKK